MRRDNAPLDYRPPRQSAQHTEPAPEQPRSRLNELLSELNREPAQGDRSGDSEPVRLNMDESQQRAILDALTAAGCDPDDAPRWLPDIDATLTVYARFRGQDPRLVTSASREDARKIGEQAHKLRSRLTSADREALAYALCRDGRTETYEQALLLIRGLAGALDLVEGLEPPPFEDSEGQPAKPKGGRTPNEALRLAILHLADTYHAATGKRPAVSDASTTPSGYSGKFFPFLASCLRPVHELSDSALGQAAQTALKDYDE